MKKRIAALALALFAAFTAPVCVTAEEEYLPTVYIADDVWYKDKSQPMITDGKDGFYIPIDAFGALPGVTVTADTTVNAVRLTFGEKAFSADTENGTVILPNGDRSISIKNEYGTIYLNVEDACMLLGLTCETHFYSNGKRAVRINDGSGTLDMSVLVRMFVSQPETLTRMTGELASPYPRDVVTVADYFDLNEIISRIDEGNTEFILALQADLILYEDSTELCRVLVYVYDLGIPITLFAHKENPDTVLHYVHNANTRLLELMHVGTHLYTPTTELSENDRTLIEQKGYIITDFTFEEVE